MTVLSRIFLIVLIAIASRGSCADQLRKVPVVGVLFGSNPTIAAPFDQALRNGLAALGYVDTKTVSIVPRYANGDATKFQALMREFMALQTDVVVVSPMAVGPALQVTNTIPIVCPTVDEPVKHGLVQSLAHPGGNLTGLSTQGADTDPKKLEFARELVPGLTRAGLLFEANDPGWVADAEAFRSFAAKAGVRLHLYEVRNAADVRAGLTAIDRDKPAALIVWNSPLVAVYLDVIKRFVLAHRLPVLSEGRNFADLAVLTYSADFVDMWRRSAAYVHKILNGAKAADLPMEQPNKFELIVNLKIAKSVGISIPESILVRADEVIR